MISPTIKIYQLKDFIRKTETGDLDYDRIVEIAKEVSTAAAFYRDHNVLLDFRDTTISADSMYEVMKITVDISQLNYVLKNKIANVIPNETNRIAIANKFEAAFQLMNFQYRFFTDFEDAIEWLSEKKDLNQPSA
jgi:hypothetical protein